MKRQSDIIVIYNILFPAPSAPPTSVHILDVTSSSITVQWGAVDCIHRNGDITGYSVRYGVQGSGSTQMLNVSGSATTEATIFGLESATTYIIGIAAVNSAGTGEYSSFKVIIGSSEKTNSAAIVASAIGGASAVAIVVAVMVTIVIVVIRLTRSRHRQYSLNV